MLPFVRRSRQHTNSFRHIPTRFLHEKKQNISSRKATWTKHTQDIFSYKSILELQEAWQIFDPKILIESFGSCRKKKETLSHFRQFISFADFRFRCWPFNVALSSLQCQHCTPFSTTCVLVNQYWLFSTYLSMLVIIFHAMSIRFPPTWDHALPPFLSSVDSILQLIHLSCFSNVVILPLTGAIFTRKSKWDGAPSMCRNREKISANWFNWQSVRIAQ